MNKIIRTDFLVIGSGIAGLNFANQISKYGKVMVITKKELIESNTNYAQGGIAAVLNKHDSMESHIKDTLFAGAGLCDEKAVRSLVEKGPAQIRSLIDLGVGFTRKKGALCLTKEGGHSMKRIAYSKDATGKEIERAMAFHARHNENITSLENHIAVDLITDNGRCIGAIVLDNSEKEIKKIYSKVTVLATGGLGRVFMNTSNPKIATGDGQAMAYRAGAELEDLEFIQFHPTALSKKDCHYFLISETLRGEGAKLKNDKGMAFMKKYHPMADLAPRDVVARAVLNESRKGRVYLDITHIDSSIIKKRFPMIFETLWWYGIKIDKDKIPVLPAAHYSCGGIKTNIKGETSIAGLYALGEVACTGVHGANRLASNSLLESMVFSSNSIKSAAEYSRHAVVAVNKMPAMKTVSGKNIIDSMRAKLREIMWDSAGIERNEKDMKQAIKKTGELSKKSDIIFNKGLNERIIELRNMLCIGKLVLRSALIRQESRGGHYRTDFPGRDDKNWRKHIIIKNADNSI